MSRPRQPQNVETLPTARIESGYPAGQLNGDFRRLVVNGETGEWVKSHQALIVQCADCVYIAFQVNGYEVGSAAGLRPNRLYRIAPALGFDYEELEVVNWVEADAPLAPVELKVGNIVQRKPCGRMCQVVELADNGRIKIHDDGSGWVGWITPQSFAKNWQVVPTTLKK